jgi:hypothetical protein
LYCKVLIKTYTFVLSLKQHTYETAFDYRISDDEPGWTGLQHGAPPQRICGPQTDACQIVGEQVISQRDEDAGSKTNVCVYAG